MAKLSIRQRKRINRAFVLSRADHELINQNEKNWESVVLNPIKDRIREHYKAEQGKICAYCKLPLHELVHVEHIIPKAGPKMRPEYAFYPRNLAVSCWYCNTKKSTNNDLIPWNKTPYSLCGQDYKIIHPHFDDYFDHIEIVDQSRYGYLSTKGYNTIIRFKLNEIPKLEHLAEVMMYQDDAIINSFIRLKELKGDFKHTIDRLINKLLNTKI